MPCDSQDTALNNAGRVVGYQLMGAPSYDESAAPTYHAFSGTTDLGTLGGTSSYATAINASDQVVGYSDLAANAGTQAFVYGNGSMHGLGTLGGAQSQAKAINDQGQIVGTSLAAGSATVHAFFYFSGKMSDLGEGQADAINQSGQVVGSAASGAFLTGAGGVGKTDLGSGAPIGINDAGQVVLNGAGAFLWDGAQQLDVNSLIAPTDPLIGSVKLTAVVAINNIGQILVDGHDASGWQQQYLLSPPHVAGQLATLGTLVMGAGPGQSLAGKASQAQSYYASADLPDTCRMLGALASDAMAQGGATIAQSLANELIVDVHVMMSTLGCPY
jgi:probable HAF family extracellular repeat protein